MKLFSRRFSSAVIFYQKMDILDVLYIYTRGVKTQKVSYFSATAFAKDVINKYLPDIQEVKTTLFEVREADGGNSVPRIFGNDINEYIKMIDAEKIKTNRFIRSLKKKYGEKIELYFLKSAFSPAVDLFADLNIVRHISQANGHKDPLFVVSKRLFSEQLIKYSKQKYGVDISVKDGIVYKLRSLTGSAIVLISNLIITLIAVLTKGGRSDFPGPKIASTYAMKGFTFNSTDRCDFPWLLFMKERMKDYLLCFDRKEMPVDRNMLEEMKNKGISVLAMSKRASAARGVRIFRRSRLFAAKNISGLFYVSFAWLANIFEGNDLELLSSAIKFNAEYAKYFELFKNNNVKVNIDFVDFDPSRVARHIALGHLGGISITYQVSNWPITNFIHTSAADVRFVFGPYSLMKIRELQDAGPRNIINGYINDYAFSAIKSRAADIRREITDKGASFIICYLDENSGDSKGSIVPNSSAQAVYRKLAGLVLNDARIGLILSPKRPAYTKGRLGEEVWGLVQKAVKTGRCIISGGNYMTNKYPAEMSMAADVTVALLLGGTASLECVLAGQKVMYLDQEKLYEYDEYKYGKDSYVFNDVDSLVRAIYELMENENSNKYLAAGRSAAIEQKDPFRDGRAAQRMSEYLTQVFDSLVSGRSRSQALDAADLAYTEKWGKDKVIAVSK